MFDAQPKHVPPDVEDHNPIAHIHRLHALVRMAASPAQSNRAQRVVLDAVAALGVTACAFLRCGGEETPEVLALHAPRDIDAAQVERLFVRFAPEVVAGRATVRRPAPPGHAPDVDDARLAGYLGVPFFDLRGELAGVAAVIGDAERRFDTEDEWWLAAAAQLVATTLACETLEAKLHKLEQLSFSDGDAPVSEKHIPSARSQESPKNKLTVLLVDDNRAVNNVIRRYLVKHGYQVDSAFDGLEALRLFQPSTHDVVISDVVMPHMNGWELISSLRATMPKLPIMLITGYSGNNGGVWNQSFLRQHGVVAVLNKPIDFEYLTGVLEDVAASRHAAQY